MQRIRSTFRSRRLRSMFASSGVCLLFGLSLAGCGGEDGNGNAFNGENNSAVLAVNCGLGESPNSLLVKELPVSVLDTSLGIQAVSAHISRESVDTDNYSTIMIRVHNSSSQGLAFINAVDIKCLDASGNNLVANLDVHAHGSVGDASGSWVMTCLAGGE